MNAFFQYLTPFIQQPYGPPILGLAAVVAIFLILFATRDILLRSNSLFIQLLCILIVAVLPVVGFLFYLLVRPSRFLADRHQDELLQAILTHFETQPLALPAPPKPIAVSTKPLKTVSKKGKSAPAHIVEEDPDEEEEKA